jgi:TRAP-type C4-dicarboxylate transport system substrate-binding protein
MGGSLGGEKTLVRRVSSGLASSASRARRPRSAAVVEELNVIETPYLFDDAAEADRVARRLPRPLIVTLS